MEPSAQKSLITNLVVPAVLALVLAAALVGIGWMFGSVVVIATSLHWVLFFALIVGARRRLLRSQPDRQLPAARVVAALLTLAVISGGLALTRWEGLVANGPPQPVIRLGALMLGSAFGSAFLARFFQAIPPEQIPDAPGLARIGRVGTWLALLGAMSMIASGFAYPAAEAQVSLLLMAVPAVLAIELLFTGLFALIRRPQSGAAFGADLLSVRLLGSSYNPIQSVFTSIEVTFGVDVRSSWALGFLRQVSLPLILGLGVFTWGLSAVVVVDASQQGVRERFGKVDRQHVLEPGLYVGLPWPFDRVHRVDTHRVREIPLGYADAKSDADALWTQYHAAEEFNLLLGNGRDLVTINADLQYRIGDIHAWIFGCQNPEQALEALSYRVLMKATVDRNLDEVLSQDISTFSAHIHSQIQEQTDAQGLGIEVVAFNLRGLHPPVAVAQDYQAVVAAQLDRTTYIINAQAYRQSALPMAKAMALESQSLAKAEGISRLSKAKGEAIAFNTLEAQHDANPQLFRFRRRLETLEQVLVDKPHYILDARIEQDGGTLWIIE